MAFSILSHSDRQGGSGGKNRTVLKLAHVLDQSHPVHQALEFMADRLDVNSGGTMKIEIFPNGQLGSETESIEQLQRSAVAMVKTSTAAMEGYIGEMALFGLPYLFRDEEHYWQVLDGEIGKAMLDLGEDVGIKGLNYYDSGSRSFYTVDGPILTPDDLKGKKVRVMRSKMAMDLISEMGGSPTPIPFGELYTALQQGTVDGAENNPPSFDTSRHYEAAKHYSLDEHARIPDMVLVSRKIWNNLTSQQQQWLQQAADESVVFQRDLWKRKTEESLERVIAAGVTVHRPAKEPFQKKVAGLYRQFDGTPIGEHVKQISLVK
ncbi:MAG: tripartite ATP-independent transporter DctP family solute receptor [Verrucomicrobiales bacterium]